MPEARPVSQARQIVSKADWPFGSFPAQAALFVPLILLEKKGHARRRRCFPYWGHGASSVFGLTG